MDKKNLTLPAIIVGVVVSPFASFVIYWLAIQINLLSTVPPLSPQSKDLAGLQPPHPNSPKLEPDEPNTKNLNPTTKSEEPIKREKPIKPEEFIKPEELIKPEEPIEPEEPIKPEEPTKQDDLKKNLVNNQQQPPQNISQSPMIFSEVPENSPGNSWVAINDKTITIETTLLNIIEMLDKKISTKMSENENKPNELLENQQWSTVGQQLIKAEEQITETVAKLYEIKPNEKGAENEKSNEKSVENNFNELGENKRWSIVGQQLIKTEVKVNDSITKLSQLKEKAKNQKNDE